MLKHKIIKKGPRTTKKLVHEDELTLGTKALKKENILKEYSLTKQINTIRECLITGDLTELKTQHNIINKILNKEQ